jgi:hypothetical protein
MAELLCTFKLEAADALFEQEAADALFELEATDAPFSFVDDDGLVALSLFKDATSCTGTT